MSQADTSLQGSAMRALAETFSLLHRRGILAPTTTLDALNAQLTAAQQAIVDQLVNLEPRDYGVKTPYAGELEPVPPDLVKVSRQQYCEDGEQKILGDKYVPRHVFDAYAAMNNAFMAGHPTRRLLVVSCYRSPAYQVSVFVRWLVNAYGGDVAKTIRHASPPRYSQHTIASKAAIDFGNVDGSPSDAHPEAFKDTVEYAWLRQHANDFGFYESWLEGNDYGMRAEPWHWQYLGAGNAA
jgi:LAS superfamily LD-carboxypeptidase LdcB